jgi:hypothetical protein
MPGHDETIKIAHINAQRPYEGDRVMADTYRLHGVPALALSDGDDR